MRTEGQTKALKGRKRVIDEETWCIVERRGSENGKTMLVREKRMTLMAFGLRASSFYEKHELNIARGRAAGAGRAMVHHAKQSWQKH